MVLDLLPTSLQHDILLEWISPSAVCRVARAGSAQLRTAIRTSPLAFRAAEDEILGAGCVRWFRENLPALPPLLWTKVTISPMGGETHERNGVLHCDNDLPAVIYADGSREWYQNGLPHRDGGLPAYIDANGTQEWYQNGVLHRDGDVPAEIRNYVTRYYRHGKLHRDYDLPAIVWVADAGQFWYQHGVLHRDCDRPACISADGTRRWYQHGELHRDGDQPAVIQVAQRIKEWYQRGVLHRDDDKPARVEAEIERLAWYTYGQCYRYRWAASTAEVEKYA